jgi:hypothetical protein
LPIAPRILSKFEEVFYRLALTVILEKSAEPIKEENKKWME